MAEELQSLLERIQKDGVDKAEAEAAGIVEDARAKAAAITAEAEQKAANLILQAEREAETHAERGRKTLEQAARDVVLSVGSSVDKLLRGLLEKNVADELKGETLRDVIVAVVEAYSRAGSGGAQFTVLLSSEQQKAVADSVLAVLSKEVAKGVRIKGDGHVISGFRISMEGNRIEHDFSGNAISEALCQLVRPHLGEIVKNALGNVSAHDDRPGKA